MDFLSSCSKRFSVSRVAFMAAILSLLAMGQAHASGSGLTMPTLATADLYTAGTAVLAFIGVIVGIYVVISMLKKAGGR